MKISESHILDLKHNPQSRKKIASLHTNRMSRIMNRATSMKTVPPAHNVNIEIKVEVKLSQSDKSPVKNLDAQSDSQSMFIKMDKSNILQP